MSETVSNPYVNSLSGDVNAEHLLSFPNNMSTANYLPMNLRQYDQNYANSTFNPLYNYLTSVNYPSTSNSLINDAIGFNENNNVQMINMNANQNIRPTPKLIKSASSKKKTSKKIVDPSLACPYCKKISYNKTNLEIHIRTHTGEKPFKCDICDSRFSRKGNLTRHISSHSNVKPFVCLVCGKSFPQKYNLACHLNTHAPKGSKPFKCDSCDREFAQKKSLDSHLEKHRRDLEKKRELIVRRMNLEAEIEAATKAIEVENQQNNYAHNYVDNYAENQSPEATEDENSVVTFSSILADPDLSNFNINFQQPGHR